MARKTEIRYINCYISGSAAYQVEPKSLPKNNQSKLPAQRRRKKLVLYVDPIAILGICVAFVMFVLMIAGAVKLNAAQKQAAEMNRYVATLQVQNEALRAEYEAGFDLDEVRQIAEARGMIPAEQAQQVRVQLSVPQEVEEPSTWENFLTFLTGLFA